MGYPFTCRQRITYPFSFLRHAFSIFSFFYQTNPKLNLFHTDKKICCQAGSQCLSGFLWFCITSASWSVMPVFQALPAPIFLQELVSNLCSFRVIGNTFYCCHQPFWEHYANKVSTCPHKNAFFSGSCNFCEPHLLIVKFIKIMSYRYQKKL